MDNLGSTTADANTMSLISRLWAKLFNARFTLAVGAQALVSGFHFVLNLVLLRVLDQYDYGLFAFAFVLGMFAMAINNALISTPLTVYTPVLKDEKERQQQEHMLGTANLLFSGALCLTGLIYGLVSSQHTETIVGITVFVALYSSRHFSRSAGYARMRPLVTAAGDVCYVMAGIVIIGLLLATTEDLSVGQIVLGLAVANLLAIAAERFRLHGTSALRFEIKSLGRYGEIWEQSRWALAGALTTLFMAQAHSVIITGTHGPSAFAPLAAGFVLFGPVRVALLTWQNLVKPEIAVAVSENRMAAVAKRIKHSATLMAIAVFVMSILLYFTWQWIHEYLYAEKYGDEPMGFIVAMWSIITLCAAVTNAPSAGLQALRDFRILAHASMYGAIISIVVVSTTLFLFNPESTLFGILLAELFVSVFLIKVVSGKLRETT